jgi:hypothetical protein
MLEPLIGWWLALTAGVVKLGLEPHLLSDTLIVSMFDITKRYAHRVRSRHSARR